MVKTEYLCHVLLPVGQVVLHPVHDGSEDFLLRRDVQLAGGDELLHLQQKRFFIASSSSTVA